MWISFASPRKAFFSIERSKPAYLIRIKYAPWLVQNAQFFHFSLQEIEPSINIFLAAAFGPLFGQILSKSYAQNAFPSFFETLEYYKKNKLHLFSAKFS